MAKNYLFSFISIPKNVDELMAMPEYTMKCPFARAALTILVLCRYTDSPEDSMEMLNHLMGPGQLPGSQTNEIEKILERSEYIPYSYLNDATPENGYEPSLPFTVLIKDTPYSYKNTGYVTLYVRSSGADSPRYVRLRKQESTEEWFVWDYNLLDSVTEPASFDPWESSERNKICYNEPNLSENL